MGQVISNFQRKDIWINSVETREEEKINKGEVIKVTWMNSTIESREEEKINKGVVIKEKWMNSIIKPREEENINKGVVIKETWMNSIIEPREEEKINKGVVIKERQMNSIEPREEEKINIGVVIKEMRMNSIEPREEEKINKGVLMIKEKSTKSREPSEEENIINGVMMELQKWINSIEPREEENINKRVVKKEMWMNSMDQPRKEEKINKRVVIKEIWMNDYCSLHKILLVGEGDFSFSASLAVAFGSATNIIATSLDSRGFLRANYRSAMSNKVELNRRGCKVVHGVDATEMTNNVLFKGMKFDRIVFNFPLAGFFRNTSRKAQLRIHRKLVGQFLVNAKKMITSNGEIHIRNKSNGFFREWNLEHLGSIRGLRLIEEVHFNFTDYPGYNTKYGFGGDKNFDCNPSKTYKFGLP